MALRSSSSSSRLAFNHSASCVQKKIGLVFQGNDDEGPDWWVWTETDYRETCRSRMWLVVNMMAITAMNSATESAFELNQLFQLLDGWRSCWMAVCFVYFVQVRRLCDSAPWSCLTCLTYPNSISSWTRMNSDGRMPWSISSKIDIFLGQISLTWVIYHQLVSGVFLEVSWNRVLPVIIPFLRFSPKKKTIHFHGISLIFRNPHIIPLYWSNVPHIWVRYHQLVAGVIPSHFIGGLKGHSCRICRSLGLGGSVLWVSPRRDWCPRSPNLDDKNPRWICTFEKFGSEIGELLWITVSNCLMMFHCGLFWFIVSHNITYM